MKHRGIAMSKNGMVASAHTLISSSGIRILAKGGNAMDAAVAMANTSGVVLPDMCGFGGDVFFLYYDGKTKKVTAVNGSGCAPELATINEYTKRGCTRVPADGVLSVTVPGEVDALYKGLELFGTMKFEQLIEDAVDLAENGCPISEKVARHLHTDYHRLIQSDALKQMFLHDDLSPKDAGELYYNPDYATTMKKVAEHGKSIFYQGEIADQIEQYFIRKNGLIRKSDLMKHGTSVLEPISVKYHDLMIYQTPPVSQGIIHLEEMNILNQFDFSKIEHNSAEMFHLLVQAKKQSFADRIKYFGDPEFVSNPIKDVLSEDYAKKIAEHILSNTQDIDDVLDFNEFGHTTSFVVVDKWGNACSFIHSVSNTWGSLEVVDNTGILLNNRGGTGFNLNPNHPNCIAPNKRTMHTLNTYLVTDLSGNLKYVGNTPGGDNQPQWNMQNLVNVIDYKMDIQSALETIKWSSVTNADKTGFILKIESGLDHRVYECLREKGHVVQVIEPLTASGASSLIEIRENGVYYGAADPRGDGCAIGL